MDSQDVLLQAVLNEISSIGIAFGHIKRSKTCHLFIVVCMLCCY